MILFFSPFLINHFYVIYIVRMYGTNMGVPATGNRYFRHVIATCNALFRAIRVAAVSRLASAVSPIDSQRKDCRNSGPGESHGRRLRGLIRGHATHRAVCREKNRGNDR